MLHIALSLTVCEKTENLHFMSFYSYPLRVQNLLCFTFYGLWDTSNYKFIFSLCDLEATVNLHGSKINSICSGFWDNRVAQGHLKIGIFYWYQNTCNQVNFRVNTFTSGLWQIPWQAKPNISPCASRNLTLVLKF